MEGFKYCSNKNCGRGLLPFSEFPLIYKNSNKYYSRCKKCNRARNNKFYSLNKEKINAKNREFKKKKQVKTINDYSETEMKNFSIRFWSNVNRLGPDECWEWKGYIKNDGYGLFSVNSKLIAAHRMSYRLTKGKIEGGLYVCHKCDNRPCVNPNHLFLGTAKDNSDDCMNKGRHKAPTGENHPSHKLTEKDVLLIRELYKTGTLRTELSKKYRVSYQTINSIVKNRIWKKVEGGV